MVQYYYMSVQNSSVGPFSLEQLRRVPLLAQTMVWKTGLPQWMAASNFPELADMFGQYTAGQQAPPYGQQGYGHHQHGYANGYGYGGFAGTFAPEVKVYSEDFSTDFLSPEQVKYYSQHGFNTTFHPVLVIFLHLVTFGLFTIIWHGLKHDKLPKIQHDDFGAGKAIGYLFIPYYNLYWLFVFWKRTVGRINFQFQLRRLPLPISPQITAVVCVFMVIPYINLIALLILLPILSVQIQNAANQLAEMQQQQF